MLNKLKNVLKRSVGILISSFIPGMAAGAPTVGWFLGGVTGVLTVFSSVLIYFGVQLAWDATISEADIEKGFRAAVAKQAENNKDIKAALDETEGTPEAPAAPVEAKDFTLTTPAAPAAPAAPATDAPATGLAPDPFG